MGTTTYEWETVTHSSGPVNGNKSTASAGASGGYYVEFTAAGAINDWHQATIAALASGIYTVTFVYRGAPSRGWGTFLWDGAAIGGTCDEYNAGFVDQINYVVGTVTVFTGGADHTLRITVTGHNASSTGYTCTADAIKLTSTHAKPKFIQIF
jgi:hypothetical protein